MTETAPSTLEDYSEFETWIKGFSGYHGGLIGGTEWFNEVQNAHQDIRQNLLCGTEAIFDIHGVAKQNEASYATAKPIIDKIIQYMPGIVYSLPTGSREDLLLPTLRWGSHDAKATSKFLKKFTDEFYPCSRDFTCDLKNKTICNLIAQLGNEWNKARSHELDMTVKFSTAAQSFVSLGHYGPDEDSCFRQGHDNQKHKYRLGQTKNSLVITINIDKNCNARCFGFVNDSMDTLYLANIYMSSEMNEADVLDAIRASFSILKGVEPDQVSTAHGKLAIENIFHNPYGNIAFSILAENAVRPIAIKAVDEIEGAKFKCPRCGTVYVTDGDFGYDCDDELVCGRCLDNDEGVDDDDNNDDDDGW